MFITKGVMSSPSSVGRLLLFGWGEVGIYAVSRRYRDNRVAQPERKVLGRAMGRKDNRVAQPERKVFGRATVRLTSSPVLGIVRGWLSGRRTLG